MNTPSNERLIIGLSMSMKSNTMKMESGLRPLEMTLALSTFIRMVDSLLFLMAGDQLAKNSSDGKTTSDSYSRMKTEMSPNKGVQGTAHKVRCPLTPDVL